MEVGSLSGETKYFREDALVAETDYTYRVRSFGDEGTSKWSPIVTLRTLGASGSAWYRDFSEYGQVSFPDPKLGVRSTGTYLDWNNTALAPSCAQHYWEKDVGFAYMQRRKLDSNGFPLENWRGINPFGPSGMSCEEGRFFEASGTALSGSDAGWPYWELRLVPYWQKDFISPRVLMLARTTAAGLTNSIDPSETPSLIPPDAVTNNCTIPAEVEECLHTLMYEYNYNYEVTSFPITVRINQCPTSGGPCVHVQTLTYHFAIPEDDDFPKLDDEHPENPPEGWPDDWRGTGPNGSREGAWYKENPDGSWETVHPDFGGHPARPASKGDHVSWQKYDAVDRLLEQWERAKGYYDRTDWHLVDQLNPPSGWKAPDWSKFAKYMEAR